MSALPPCKCQAPIVKVPHGDLYYHIPEPIIPLVQAIWDQKIEVEKWALCKRRAHTLADGKPAPLDSPMEDVVHLGFLHDDFIKFMNLTRASTIYDAEIGEVTPDDEDEPYDINISAEDTITEYEEGVFKADWKILCIIHFKFSFIETVMARLKRNAKTE